MSGPNSRLVAEFLGAANVLPIVVRNGRTELAGGMPIEIATAPPSDAAWLAIRPERMTLGATDAANRVAGVVVQRSYAGETLTHLVRLADGSTLRATVALRQGLNAAQAGIGDTVTLSWDADACIVLQSMNSRTRQDRGIGSCMGLAAGAADTAHADRTKDRVFVPR